MMPGSLVVHGFGSQGNCALTCIGAEDCEMEADIILPPEIDC